jgi:hypothetical protein
LFVRRICLPSSSFVLSFSCLSLVLLLPLAADARSHTRHSSHSRSSRSVTSRGVVSEAVDPSAFTHGRVAQVVTDNAPIIADRAEYGRLLSRCASGMQLIVVGETGNFYAVKMADYTIGYILKTDVQLTDCEVTVPDDLNPLQHSLIDTATAYLNVTPYVYGGTSRDGIDCSGLIQAVFSANGMKLPRTAHEQAGVGYTVPLDDLSQWKPGDRLYFQCHHSYIDHTGMYIGGGLFIQSSIDKHGVNITPISSGYYRDHLVAVRRSPELASTEQAQASAPSAPDYEASQE